MSDMRIEGTVANHVNTFTTKSIERACAFMKFMCKTGEKEGAWYNMTLSYDGYYYEVQWDYYTDDLCEAKPMWVDAEDSWLTVVQEGDDEDA